MKFKLSYLVPGPTAFTDYNEHVPSVVVVFWRLTIIFRKLSMMSIKPIKPFEFYWIVHKRGKLNSLNSYIIENPKVLSDFL